MAIGKHYDLDTDGTLANNSDNTIASQKAVKTYVDTKADNTNIINGALLSNATSYFFGTSSTAAATVQKEVSIPSITTLSAGQIIIIKPTTTSTVADSTIKLNSFDAYPMRYKNAAITTSSDSIVWPANVPTIWVFDGSYWHFAGRGADDNTTYSNITTGTSNVNYIEVNKVPADYSLKSENAVFSIGASFKNSASGIEWKANAILDNLKIYDFAMTEEQMTELRWTGKVCKSPITISSTIENGTVTANKAEALTGERVLLDVQPDVGYEIDKVYVNDMEILPLDGIYYTKMTKAGVSVYATFKEIVLEEEEPDSSGNSLNNSASNEINSEVNSAASSESVQEELTSLNSEQEQSGASEKSGCFGTVSAMAIPIIFATMSAGLCIRKKEYE